MSTSPPLLHRRILIVDDNAAIHDDFRKILAPANPANPELEAAENRLFGESPSMTFHIDVASQGEEALKLVQQATGSGQPYALAFVDFRMPPGWNGMETAKRLWQVSPDLQIVICTAFADCSWDVVLKNLGPVDQLLILKKPFDSIEALQLATALTEKWRLQQASQLEMDSLEDAVAHRTRDLEAAKIAALNMMEDAVKHSEHAEHALEKLEIETAERKRAESQLRLQSAALNAAANSVLITSREGTIQWVNPAFTKTSGYTLEESVGRNPGELLKSGRHDPAFYQTLWDTILRGEVWHGEITNRRKDQTLITEESTITPVRGELGEITHFISIKQDITQRKLIEGQLVQAQKLEAIGQLAGGIAHDFNNILAVVMMQAELLSMTEDLPQEVRDGLLQVSAAAQRGANLTRQLLLFSRKQTVQAVELDLNEAVTSLAKMLHRVIGENVNLELELDTRPLITHADPGMLDQVVMNLVLNARDALARGGQIVVGTSRRNITPEEAALVPEARTGPHVCLRVTDNGTGMPPEVKAHIFEPFFTTKAAGKGTGLGLATVFGIVKQHGGWMEVASEVGDGTTFLILLPEHDSPTGVNQKKPGAAQVPRGSETVLVVEDEDVVRAMTVMVLQRAGYRVLEAASGVEAVKVWARHRTRIRLVVTDMVMPDDMTGWELADKLQAEDPTLKVIYTSGYSPQAAGEVFEIKGEIHFLQKPYSAQELARLARQVLNDPPPGPPVMNSPSAISNPPETQSLRATAAGGERDSLRSAGANRTPQP